VSQTVVGRPELEAARLLLERMGISPADLLEVRPTRPPAPTFAEYVPVVTAAVSSGTRRAYGSYWNRVVQAWGDRRIDEPRPSEIEQLRPQVQTNVVARRNARGGRSAATDRSRFGCQPGPVSTVAVRERRTCRRRRPGPVIAVAAAVLLVVVAVGYLLHGRWRGGRRRGHAGAGCVARHRQHRARHRPGTSRSERPWWGATRVTMLRLASQTADPAWSRRVHR
jgi:hypothetical protein